MVERGGLENRYTFTGIGGSNPPLSAITVSQFPVLSSQFSIRGSEAFENGADAGRRKEASGS